MINEATEYAKILSFIKHTILTTLHYQHLSTFPLAEQKAQYGDGK